MDSVTQAALGAAIGGAIAPSGQRRKALLVGAALGTLPDLDVFIDYGDAVANFTYHRGFSHSLFVLPPFALLLWLALRRWWAPVSAEPARWLAIIGLALITHPLLDAHTAYGTQLFWPLEPAPAMWATLFIIDPLYTLPLLVGVAIVAARPGKRASATAVRACLALSTLYLGWSWLAQSIVARHTGEVLAERILLHPHDTEQPFTRSESNITIPPELTQVIVRAKDNDEGFGGQEIIVDLTVPQSDYFEVVR